MKRATTPKSALRHPEQPKNAAASFLADDDPYDGLRAPENKCWICEDTESKGKFKECDFCGQSSC